MMDKRLLGLVPEAMRHVLLNVLWQWVTLLANAVIVYVTCRLLVGIVGVGATPGAASLMVCAVAIVVRLVATKLAADQSFAASYDVKRILRRRIYEKVLALGPRYAEQIPTAEVVQLAVEGTEQLETYFGQYLPQLFYAVLAPLTLFGMLVPISLTAAVVLLIFVPLIPVVIVIIQKIAKRILGAYWDEYANLADNFLENLQGLSTLKIYGADAARHERMDAEAEHFRVVTMKVLTMQLNSIIVMDVVALGGAAAGIWVVLAQLTAGRIDLFGCLFVILLSADFFIPMRRLGSYFHVAMNGMAAADKIFRLLAIEEPAERTLSIEQGDHLSMHGVSFSYDGGRKVLDRITLDIPEMGLTAIVGESGSGKSTVAALLAGCEDGCRGDLLVGNKQLRDVSRSELARFVTTVPSGSFLFAGTVRDNLLLAAPDATDEQLWSALEQTSLAAYLRTLDGLDTRVEHAGENFSGGQRQRLALARALLSDARVLILDEATSNIDVESEEAVMDAVRSLARDRAVVVISHRLANVTAAQRIYVLEAGRIVGEGTHEELLKSCSTYRDLWEAQQELERYGRGEMHA